MKQQISTDNAPRADHILSQGIISEGTVYVAGQIHQRPNGTIIDGSVKEKVDQIMQNIAAILQGAGASLDDIVKVVIYVTDMTQMQELNEVYPTYFTHLLPVREAIGVQSLPLGATIEISVIAIK